MPRPCRHPDFTPGCRPCWLARHDARYMRLWGVPGEPDPVPPGSEFRPAPGATSVRPCAHLGDPLTGLERQALGLDHRLDWRRCGLGLSVGGSPPGVVCRCRGCGPRCPGYGPENDAARGD